MELRHRKTCATKSTCRSVIEWEDVELPQPEHPQKVIGVTWDKSKGKWKADASYRSRKYFLGRFDNHEDAVQARREFRKTHPAYARYGV